MGIMHWALMSTLCACAYSAKTTRQMLESAEKNPYDLIVVPGVPLENDHWSRTMKGRIYWSKYLYERGIAKNIMYSGNAVYTPYYEGIVMAMYAIALGVPSGHVFSETRAEHSTENIYYSYRKARMMGFERIALASDPFQTKMLSGFVRKKVDPSVGLIPMVLDTLRMMEPEMQDPSIDFTRAAAKDFVSLSKREHFFKRLKGTRGLNIDTTAYQAGSPPER